MSGLDVTSLDVLPAAARAALDGSPALVEYDDALTLASMHVDVIAATHADGGKANPERACARLAFAHAIAVATWRQRACA